MTIRLSGRFLLISLVLVGVALTSAQAQVSEPQRRPEAANEEENEQAQNTGPEKKQPDSKTLQHHYEVTVTARRTPTALREIGQSITVITAEDIEAQGARDVLQILETIPGFNVVRTGSFGGVTSVFVRGGESDFNLVLIDGVQVNQPGGAFDLADLTTTNIERIEIVRGPSSVLYGADAVTSAINIITRKGEGKPSGNFRFEGGTYDSYLLRGSLQGGLERFHYSLGAHYSESDGFYDFNNQYDKVELSADTAFELNSSSVIAANVRHIDSEYHFPTDSTGAVV
ncbi:TonB-dependent receptor plug domain-containing protein, partial [Acidobacteria bacterium AH-259-D05]|nr:TonB-dependent receptor plug domain-containing protein [Acidobacteria bacterium AH-259-D05]